MKYVWSVASGEKIFQQFAKMHKITNSSNKNRGDTPILAILVGAHPRNIHTKLEANLCRVYKKLNI